MKTFFYIFSFCFLSIVFLQCQGPVQQNLTLNSVFKKHQTKGLCALYDYANENIIINNKTYFQDSFFQANELAYFFASLLMIEKGILFNERQYYSYGLKKTNLLLALNEKNKDFFQTYTNLIPLMNIKEFTNIFANPNFKPPFDIVDSNSLTNLKNIYLNADQMLGFFSKYYYKKLPFQDRTLDISKTFFIKDTIQGIEFNTFKIQVLPDFKYLEIGWFEKDNKPFFYLFLSPKKLDNSTFKKDFFEYLKMFANVHTKS